MCRQAGKNSPFKVHRDSRPTAQENFLPEEQFPSIEFRPVPFDLRRVRLALFDSSYRSPIMLPFPREHAHIKLATDVTMTVELAHAIYAVWEGEEDESYAECYDTPEWYLRGVAHFTGPTGESETAPAHAFVTIESDDNSIKSVEVQIVTDVDRLMSRPN